MLLLCQYIIIPYLQLHDEVPVGAGWLPSDVGS